MHGAKQGEKMTAGLGTAGAQRERAFSEGGVAEQGGSGGRGGPRGTETPWKLRGCGGATSAPRARRAEACAL